MFLSGWWYHLFLCAISEHRLPTETCFLDGLLMDREERLDEWDNLCFGLESLIQPLITCTRYHKDKVCLKRLKS